MSGEAADDNQGAFRAIKISLPSQYMKRLNRLARNHHLGNRSQCIRRALDRYEDTLDNGEEVDLEELKSAAEDIKQVAETIEDDDADEESADQEKTAATQSFEEHLAADAREVRNHLTGELRSLNQIVENAELSELRVRCALAYLENRGHAERASDQPKYRRSATENTR